MRSPGFKGSFRAGPVFLGALLLLAQPHRPVAASAPEVTIGPAGVKIRAAQASLSETIDALARAGRVKVTYDGARPSVMLFDLEIDASNVPQALFRLLEGQNLNYGVVFDLSGRNITSLMVLGVPSKPVAPSVPVPSRPLPFAAPRPPLNDLPPVDDDPAESEMEEPEQPEPTPTPATTPRRLDPPVSPFAPRPIFGSPFGPRPTPPPPPTPSPSP